MSLEALTKQIKEQSNGSNIPPVELWDPPYCGDMDLVIKGDGSWFHNGSVFKRLSLVKLLASVLKREQQDYFLVTPVEKIKIYVEDQPFIITQWRFEQREGASYLVVNTNLEDEFVVSEQNPVVIKDEELLVLVRRNLWARVHRNVYYQWVEIAAEVTIDNKQQLLLHSGDYKIVLGEY